MDKEKLKVHKLFETLIYVYKEDSYVKPLIKATDKYIEEGKVYNKDKMKKRDKIYKKKVGDIGLNFMTTNGYVFEQAYTVTIGQSNVYHFLMSKK